MLVKVDAFVIELPYRRGVFLIDAGASFNFENFEPNATVYNRVLRPYLMGRGIQSIDTIFVSHPHLDHHGSVRYLLEEFKVGEIVLDPFYPLDEQELLHWYQKSDVQIKLAKVNEAIVRKGHSFFVLSPHRDRKDANDNSLVLLSKIGQKNWLFTGDISKSIEKEIVKKYPSLSVDFLKVAHHGSKTSTAPELIEAIRPRYAFIPVGVNNRYDHPAEEVIDLLAEYEVKVYRADHHGAVQYKYREGKSTIVPFVEENKKAK